MADDARYNIVFRGELVSGADPARVRANLAKLFRMEADRVEKLFAGRPVVVKKNADQATAMKTRALLKKAGAECEMQPLDSGGATAESAASSAPSRATFNASEPSASPAQPAPEPAGQEDGGRAIPATGDSGTAAAAAEPLAGVSAEAGQPPGDMEMVGTIRTGGTGFSGEFEVAPAGAELVHAESDEAPVAPDISHLSLAPPGTDLEQLQSDDKVKVPDISHLKVVDDATGGSG